MKKKLDFEDENFMKFLEQHLKEEMEKQYNISYEELSSLEEEQQDKIIDNVKNQKRKRIRNKYFRH